MKYCGILALALIAAIIASSVSAQSHSITWGDRLPRDGLIQREIFNKKSKWMQIVSGDLVFKTDKTITQIIVTDQYTNGKGGYATLLSGGPQSKTVTIHGKSQRGHGFNFIVEIYAL